MNNRVKAMLAVAAASFSFALAAGEVPFVRKVSYAEQPGNRERTFDRTMIFAQLECYGPHQNMMHRFTNRALYTDIRDRKKDTWTFADFRRDTAMI